MESGSSAAGSQDYCPSFSGEVRAMIAEDVYLFNMAALRT